MSSEHSGCDNSIDEIKHEVEFVETIKEEPAENELNRESECENSYHEQFDKWCEPDLIKLEDLQTDNVKCEIDYSKLGSDEDDKPLKKIIEEVAVKKEDPGDYPEDPLDTPDCVEVKIEDELDIKDEDVKIETDEEELDEDESEDEADLVTSLQQDDIQESKTSSRSDKSTKLSNLPSDLARQENIHTEKKPFQCQICSRSFSRKFGIKRHGSIHTGEKPFHCKICSKSFKRKYCLKEHERIHSGEKPFQCKICLKSFTQKYDLNRHTIVHTREKPYQCKSCPKTFSQEHILVLHERIHIGDKRFHCEVCLKPFAAKYLLIQHERIHTGEKPFHCKGCSKSFRLKGELKKHEKTHLRENSARNPSPSN